MRVAEKLDWKGLTFTVKYCALFSLEPLAHDPRKRDMDMRYVNLFTPLPFRRSALTET
jgi:hypothetical protein